jgi:O-antigen ligase
MISKDTPRKVIRTCTFLILLLVPLAFSTHLDSSFLIAKTVLFRALLLVMFPCAFYLMLRGVMEGRVKLIVVIPMLCFIMANALSTLFSISPMYSMERLVELLSYGVAFYIWCRALRGEDRDFYFKAITIAGFLASCYALCQHGGIDLPGIHWSQQEMVRYRSIGTFGNPTFLAGFLVVALPLMFYMAATARGIIGGTLQLGRIKLNLGFRMKAIYGIAWLSTLTALLMTYTRGAWVALFCSFLFLLGMVWGKIGKRALREFIFFMIGAILVLSCVFVMQLRSTPPENVSPEFRLNVIGRLQSMSNMKEMALDRFFLWRIGILNFRDHMLIGTGPGSFPYVFPKYRYIEPPENRGRIAVPEACHNEFVEIASATGILGLLSYLFIIASLFYVGFRKMHTGNDDEKLHSICILAALSAYLIHGFFLYSTISSTVLWWFLASLLAQDPEGEREPGDSPRLGPSRRIAMIVVMALCFFLFCINVRSALGSYYLNEAKKAQEAQNWKESLTCFNMAIFFDPWQYRYHLFKGKMLEGLFMNKPIAALPPEILNSYAAAIFLNPGDPYARADKGRFCGYLAERFDRSKADDAIESYRAAIRLDSYNPLFYNDLGNLMMALGREREGLACYEGGLAVDPRSPVLNFNMALNAWKRKDLAATRSYCEKALSANPSYQKALDLLKEVDTYEKKHQGARGILCAKTM